MLSTSTRVLRLLSLFQTRAEWSGRDLGARLEVDVRTLRRDIDRLRALGYAIASSAGVGGGYRLGQGNTTPPLLLDDDEAVAVAVSLAANGGSVTGRSDVAVGVLAKLNQVLPPRVRRKLGAISAATVALPDGRPRIDFGVLTTVAGACRDGVEVRFAYSDAVGAVIERTVEPLRLVHARLRWYLVAWDVDRADFRTFRLDRVTGGTAELQGRRFIPREPPGGFEAYVARSLVSAPCRFHARLLLHGAVAEWAETLPSWLGTLEAYAPDRTLLTVSADREASLLALIVHVDAPFELLEPQSLAPAIEAMARRMLAGVVTGGASSGASTPPAP
ncbi:MAG: helix-turn-helix transcriptional regulator [Bradymonadia bacterium]